MGFEGGRPFFPYAVRRNFREFLQIPDGVHMWIANFQGKYKFSGRFTGLYAKPAVGTFDYLQYYVFTFAAGSLAFQVVSSRWAKLHQVGTRFPHIIHPDEYAWCEAATRFWPRDGFPVQWPPKRYLSDDGIDEFIVRWRNMAISP